ncbi:hypothetical protein Tco_1447371 [Tanacetum coccineum]
MPHDSPISGVARVTSLETELKKTKEVHCKALTKLMKKVKRGFFQTGEMEETEYADVEEENAGVEYDFDLTEQQVTPLKTPQVEEQSQETFEVELSVLSAAKIIVETFKERVKTYNRRRRISQKVQEEEQTKVLEQQEQERANLEAALNLQKLFDQERKEADDIAWSKIVEQAQLKSSGLVKEKFRSVEPTEDMERALWVELKRIYKPDKEDTLGNCIYMLPEKDYPLITAVMMSMLSRRLRVEEDSEMARDLVKKIFIEANRSRS